MAKDLEGIPGVVTMKLYDAYIKIKLTSETLNALNAEAKRQARYTSQLVRILIDRFLHSLKVP